MDKTKVIALFNQSGGVGKSTLTMNLGYQLAQHKQRVLLIDLDPQASLTIFMGLNPEDLEKTGYDAIMGDEQLPIHTNIHDVDICPANINLSGAEIELVLANLRDFRLKEAIEPVLKDYDFILIDCPPSLGILSYISLVAATHVLIPVHTEYKTLRGTELLLQTIARVKKKANTKLKIAGCIPTMFDSRTHQGKISLQSIETGLSPYGTIFPVIPRSVAFADATQNHIPLAKHSANHPALTSLNQIAESLGELD